MTAMKSRLRIWTFSSFLRSYQMGNQQEGVRFGSLADVPCLDWDVRFTPNSGQTQDGRFVR